MFVYSSLKTYTSPFCASHILQVGFKKECHTFPSRILLYLFDNLAFLNVNDVFKY